MTEKELIEIYLKENKVTKCPTKWAKGVIKGGWKTTPIRNKKSCNYKFDSPCGIRTMNYESIYNAPATNNNGAKLSIGKEGTNYSMG